MTVDLYGVVKALHVVSMVAWMAGLLYLPRLFVYHAEAGPQAPESATFKIMERRLLRVIMNPAMVATWLFGGWMLYLTPGWLADGWMHVKLLCVVAVTVFHHLLVRWWKALEQDRNRISPKVFRAVNEIPAVLMVIIVFMVILKPF